jgi:hypothetical protein
MDKRHCAGCTDDFYNDHNPLGVKECWCLKTAKLATRWRIHRDVPTCTENFTKVKVPTCYRATGWCFTDGDKIPAWVTSRSTWKE